MTKKEKEQFVALFREFEVIRVAYLRGRITIGVFDEAARKFYGSPVAKRWLES